MPNGVMVFAHKKQIIDRNSYPEGEVSGSSIFNDYQAKIERRRQLTGVRTERVGRARHASVAKSRITEFLASATPWEHYFRSNPHSGRFTFC
ncbi:hypothetical protein NPIL_623861 [Nephila pilipes]|uniref:Uncharacterized protein n=1 Tax=Nephila pilipes TaxID=299642 RepID=A0A8X6PJR8_NEPPI|nr:hypothetical protein NPIL_623861 [Nephila pilipes]